MMRMKSRLARALLLLCLGAAGVSAAPMDSPRQLSFEVSDYRDAQGKRWIRLSCEFECAYREKMASVVATLWDFPASTKVFSRIEAVRVRSDDGARAVTEQRTGVRVLGLAFISNLVFLNTLTRPGPSAAVLSFETIETDDSCLSTKGAWYLEERSDASGPVTVARYVLDSYVEPRFPGQAVIMRSFGAGDIKMLMRELGAAMTRS